MSLLVTIPINLQKNINIFQGSHGKYYTIETDNLEIENLEIENLNNEILKYDIHFPFEWADDDKKYSCEYFKSQVGPRYCYNCIHFGFHNGVFIGYCANCANILEYSRGNGLLPDGEEVSSKTIAFDLTNIKEKNSIWNTYLNKERIEEIGDVALKEHYEIFKDLPPLIAME